MKLKVFLVLSLCFNVFFVTGIFIRHNAIKHGKMPKLMMKRMFSKLDIEQEEKQALLTIVKESRPDHKLIKEKMKPIMAKLWEESIKDNPEQELIDTYFVQMAEVHTEVAKNMQGKIAAYIRTLPMERRKVVAKEIQDNFPLVGRPPKAHRGPRKH